MERFDLSYQLSRCFPKTMQPVADPSTLSHQAPQNSPHVSANAGQMRVEMTYRLILPQPGL